MNVLVFNPGSGSLKFELISAEPQIGDAIRGRKLLRGIVEPIGAEATLSVFEDSIAVVREPVSVRDYGDAARALLAKDAIKSRKVDLVAFRVVHGGDCYTGPVHVDDGVIDAIEQMEELAPLHNAPSVAVMRVASTEVAERVPRVAVFDTAFHRMLPDVARHYAIPWELAVRHRIRRYGFHGISHQYLMLRYAELTATSVAQTKIVSLHLEGGSSATAISGGRSVDTSMGFTPLEGLVMGTRSGDIDPALMAILAEKEGVKAREVETWLNKNSGLLGVSGVSQDTRVLMKHAADNPRARLALEIFAYRVKKYIGAYLAALNGATAIVFGGAISENTPHIRSLICEGLDWLGLDLDPLQNDRVIDREGRITRDGSRLDAYVIPSEEGLMIAHEALRFHSGGPQ